MKNFKLFLASTAILSTGALAVMADDLPTATLNTEVRLIRSSITMAEISPIQFGTIYAENGAVVVAVPNGGHGDGTTARPFDPVYGGQLQIRGDYFDALGIGYFNNYDTEITNINTNLDGLDILEFTNITPLKDGDIVCGEIREGSLTQIATMDEKGGINIGIGGTLVLDNNIEASIATANRGLDCKGTITATVIAVIADDFFPGSSNGN